MSSRPAAEDLDVAGQLQFRKALGKFVTGVTVAATMDSDGRPRGLTINSFTSVSLDPPLILICIAKSAASCEAFSTCDAFSVNVLEEGQRHISDLFASKAADKFERVRWTASALGVPLIDGSLVAFDCRVENRHEAGDHNIIVGRVSSYRTEAGKPLVYGVGGYISLELAQEAIARSQGQRVVASCIVERDGRIVLVREHNSTGDVWSLPHEEIQARAGNEPFLMRTLRQLGITAEITFLYSIFEASDGSGLQIVYRAQVAAAELRDPAREFLEDDVPWERLALRESAGMLRRYFREKERDQFGIYTDVPGGVARVVRIGAQPDTWDAYVSTFEKSR
jgi:flavin-dependent trigonelline monooxygenase, reductase component